MAARKDVPERRGRKATGRRPTAPAGPRRFSWPEPVKGRARQPVREPWHSEPTRPGPPMRPIKPSKGATETLKTARPEEGL